MKVRFTWILLSLLVLGGCHLDSGDEPSAGQYFTVRVHNETFVMYVTNPETIQMAVENFQGKNNKFPSGRVGNTDGGYNQPWKWHYVPETVTMVEVSIEVCDALPSYVDSHTSDFSSVGYCPWGAKVVKVGR